MLTNILVVVDVLVALAIIGLVLLQHGKGADMGSGFGGGASGSLFGATGSANFLSRSTAVLAAVFFLLSLTLTYLAVNRPVEQATGVIDAVRQQSQQQKPAAEAEKKAPPQEKKAAPQAPAPQQEAPKERQVPQ